MDDVEALGAAFRAGTRTPTEHLEETLDRITTADHVRAWVTVDVEGAREQARRATAEVAAGQDRGPLHGIPVGVKDLIDVAGLPTRAGSRHFADRPPAAADAAVTARLRQAGAVLVGKTVTDEFALSGTSSPARNPWSADRIPGGSSGGSAAAVGADHVRVALGSDTAGSIRIPSSCCGTVGLKPTYGAVSVRGAVPMSWSLDHVGPITRSAGDLLAAAQALGLVDARTATAVRRATSWAGVRVGVPRADADAACEPAVREAVDAALAAVAEEGAILVPVELPDEALAYDVGFAIYGPEAADFHHERLRRAPELFSDGVRAALEIGLALPATAYVRAQRTRARMAQETNRVLASVDVVALPTLPCTALPQGSDTLGAIELGGVQTTLAQAHLRHNVLFNLTGSPAASQPCGADADGLPIGLQWVAAPHRERAVLAAVLRFERHFALGPAPLAAAAAA